MSHFSILGSTGVYHPLEPVLWPLEPQGCAIQAMSLYKSTSNSSLTIRVLVIVH